jgi:hypothetical protein
MGSYELAKNLGADRENHDACYAVTEGAAAVIIFLDNLFSTYQRYTLRRKSHSEVLTKVA